MAFFSVADFTVAQSALPTQYAELVNCVQRLSPIVRTLLLANGNTGNTLNFDVKLGGKTASTANLDGGNLPTATADIRRGVSLPYGSYVAGMQLTDRLRRVLGATQNHDFLKDAMTQDLVESMTAIVKLMNQHVYSGTGTSDQMLGLSSIVTASGAIGNLTDSTYWVSTVSENAGTPRAVTVPIIRTHLSAMANNQGNVYGRPDLAFCKSTIFDSVLSLFSITTFVDGFAGDVTRMPPSFYTSYGSVSNTGFRKFRWESEGITFIEDPDVTHTGSTNPTTGIYFVNSQAISLAQLPPAEMYMTSAQTMAAAQETLGPIAGLAFEVQPRGRTKTATEWDASTMVALKVKQRGAVSWLGDLQ